MSLELWNKFNRPPLTALKKISGGRMNNKTDINPMWRMQVITEAFGPCGIGWKYSIDKLWLEPGTEDQVCAFALISLFIKKDFTKDDWSDPIPGIGGSMLIEKTKNGPYTSDEAYKMAVTDALSVAFKALGVAAEIYLGNFDGSKYVNQPQEESPDTSEKTAQYLADCDSKTTIEGIREWWTENSRSIKKELGQANASVVYKHMLENKKILEDIAAKEEASDAPTI